MITNYWPFWWGGIAIAAVAILMVLVSGQYLSITRGYVSLCSLVSRKAYFHSPDIGGAFGIRTMFVIGVVLGGLVAAITSGGFKPSFALGAFDQLWGSSLYVKAGVLGIGGFLWGYGSRMARGCTSGNSISGMSRGSLAAVVASACFVAAGIVITFGLDLLLGGGR